jgi:hypothetical protein
VLAGKFGLEIEKSEEISQLKKFYLEMCYEKGRAGILKSLCGQKMPASTGLGSVGLDQPNYVTFIS